MGHITEIVDKVKGGRYLIMIDLTPVPKVVFHCALSQVRGPKAARVSAGPQGTRLRPARRISSDS